MSFSFFSDKSGFQMSIQVLIAMVIGLAVLIVLILIFTGKAKMFASVDQCEKVGNRCEPIAGQCADDEYRVLDKCPEEGYICCAKKPGG